MNEFFSNNYFDCQCGDFGHVYRIVMNNETGELHIEIQLRRFTFWKRLGRALKYVFGAHVDYVFYSETLIDPTQYDGLREVLRASEERAKEYAAGFVERNEAEKKAQCALTPEEKRDILLRRADELGMPNIVITLF